MTEKMLEKAAAAAYYRANGRSVLFADAGMIERAYWTALACAALLAIREPDEAAIKAAFAALETEQSPHEDGIDEVQMRAALRGYINAILSGEA